MEATDFSSSESDAGSDSDSDSDSEESTSLASDSGSDDLSDDSDDTDDDSFSSSSISSSENDSSGNSDGDSSSSSSSSSDDSSESTERSVSHTSAKDLDVSDDSSSTTSSKSEVPNERNFVTWNNDTKEMTIADGSSTRTFVPPGQGKATTRARNERRRKSKILWKLKRNGDLPPDASLASLNAESGNVESEPETIEKAREALLSSLEGADAPAEEQTLEIAREMSSPDDEAEMGPRPDQDTSVQEIANTGSVSNETSTVPPQSTVGSVAQSGSSENVAAEQGSTRDVPKPRMKIDLLGTRRMVFGSLGVSAPKNKAEEEATRAKLSSHVRFHSKPAHREDKQDERQDDAEEEEPGECENWRDRVELSAVECCHDGINLSTPPYPFVQRWDPQQQGSYSHDQAEGMSKRRGRNKRKRRSSFNVEELQYDDSYVEMNDQEEPFPPSKQTKLASSHNDEAILPEKEDGIGHQSPSSLSESQTAIDDQLQREAEGRRISRASSISSFQDTLSPLPDDLTKHPDLSKGISAPGMIIAFKKLDMSSETNWQPVISRYKVARIIEWLDDGSLQLKLATGDAPKTRQANDDGEVVYSKFDMPDVLDAASEEDSRMLVVDFAELIEPKVLYVREEMQKDQATDGQPPKAVYRSYVPGPYLQSGIESIENGEHSAGSGPNEQERASFGANPLVESLHVEAQVTADVQDMIKDAGWNSSINIDNHELKDISQSAAGLMDGSNELSISDAHDDSNLQSPKFNGFRLSSPPTSEIQVPSSPAQPYDKDEEVNEKSDHSVLSSDFSASEVQETVPHPYVESPPPSSPSSLDIPPPSSQPSQHSLEPSQLPGVSESGTRIVHYPSLGRNSPSPEIQSELAPKPRQKQETKRSEPARRSKRVKGHHQSSSAPASEPGTSPPPLRNPSKEKGKAKFIKPQVNGHSTSQPMPSISPISEAQLLNESDSDFELPDLMTILSQPRNAKAPLPRASQASSSVVIKQNETESSDFTPRQRPSQAISTGTEIVDLLSDDVESTHENGSLNLKSQELPSGPGWVKKANGVYQ